jgi:tetratricopeptide (TPR) repeat protein
MRLGRLPQRTGDPRADAVRELRWAMGGAGLTIEKLLVMDAVRALPGVVAAAAGAEPEAAPRVELDAVVGAVRDLGDGLRARLLRNALAIDYGGTAKDLTERRNDFVREHNDAARAAGSRNLLPETARALYQIEQQVIEELVTALGTLPAGACSVGPAPAAGPRVERRAAPLPRELPPATANFSGRDGALAALDRGLAGLGTAVAPAVLGIEGPPGVGKTALAVRWAHSVADRFPDGQLYVDLRGHSRDGAPVPPVAALTHFLDALGVPPDPLVAADEGRLAAAYRSATADRRLLVLLDNATSAEQVRPLVPGSPGCAVLVTSRNALPGLTVEHGATVQTLDALPPAEAVALLTAVIGPERTAADPAATAELALLCGYLPLALRIVAAKLMGEPGSSVADLAARLRDSDRLGALEMRGSTPVRTAFALSYDSLPAEEQRAFRLLGLVPGVDVTAGSAGALLDVPEAEAARLLDGLAGCHLIGRQPRLRYQFHELLGEYATDLCRAVDSEETRSAALDRLLAYYVHRTVDATALLHPKSLRLPGDVPETVPPAPLRDRDAAVAWLADEQPNLAAGVHAALGAGRPTEAWQLAYAMRGYFIVSPSGAGWLGVGDAGLAAATEAGHYHAMSAMHGLLGRAYRQAGDLPAALRHVTAALPAARDAGWRRGEVIAECTLGGILLDDGRPAEAIVHHRAALDIENELSGPESGAVHLGNIGDALTQTGEYDEALEHCTAALRLLERMGDERGVAVALHNVAAVKYRLGKPVDAAHDASLALSEVRRLGLPDLQSEFLGTLARIACERGDLDGARTHAAEALELARALKDGRLEVLAANANGLVALRSGDPDAAGWYEAATARAAEAGYRYGAVEAWAGLAAAALAEGRDDVAAEYAGAALAGAHAAGFRPLAAEVGALLARLSRPA